MWCPGTGVVLDCFDSRSLPSYFADMSFKKIFIDNSIYNKQWKNTTTIAHIELLLLVSLN